MSYHIDTGMVWCQEGHSNMITIAIDTLNRLERGKWITILRQKTRGEYNKQLNGTSRTHHRSNKCITR